MRAHSVVAVVDLADHDGERLAQSGRKRAVLEHAGLVEPHACSQLPGILTLDLQDLPDPTGTLLCVAINLLEQTLSLLRICVLDPCHTQIVVSAAGAREIRSDLAESRPRLDSWGSFFWLRPELRHDPSPLSSPRLVVRYFPPGRVLACGSLAYAGVSRAGISF